MNPSIIRNIRLSYFLYVLSEIIRWLVFLLINFGKNFGSDGSKKFVEF